MAFAQRTEEQRACDGDCVVTEEREEDRNLVQGGYHDSLEEHQDIRLHLHASRMGGMTGKSEPVHWTGWNLRG